MTVGGDIRTLGREGAHASGTSTSRDCRCSARCPARTCRIGRSSTARSRPYYDALEVLLGTQGDVRTIPALTLKHAPRFRPFPMRPGPQQRSSTLIATGAKRIGLHPYPFPTAINSVEYDGSPACNNCGFCTGYGCPISAGSARLRRCGGRSGPGGCSLQPRNHVTEGQLHRPAGHRRLLSRPAGECRRGERRRGGAGRLSDRDVTSGSALRPARRQRTDRHTADVSQLRRRVRYLPRPASARVPRPLDHAVHGGLLQPRLPRGSGRGKTGRTALHTWRPCELGGSQDPITEGKLLPGDPGIPAGGATVRQPVQGPDARLAPARPARRRQLHRNRPAVPDQQRHPRPDGHRPQRPAGAPDHLGARKARGGRANVLPTAASPR